jgi:hypothetical protein
MPGRPDIAAGAFLALREEFFTPTLRPRAFGLRDKRNTQDDPLDAHITQRLDRCMPKALRVVGAGGPLISPDLIIASPPGLQGMRKGGDLETRDLVGIEVKKLERDKHGRIARRNGLDYNSTPPSKTIAAYHDGDRIELPGFYLFVCLERESRRKYKITAMALCDGGVLNEDVDLYSATTGQREKQIGLGSYGDGLDRQRPMLVFPNPLGWSALDGAATLIHRSADLGDSRLIRVGKIRRARPSARTKKSVYFVYRDARDIDQGGEFDELNPFPSVVRRTTKTQPRGRFHVRL